MILGVSCNQRYTLPDNYFELVKERMRKFFFVGISDEYTRSLQLFHALANVGTVPEPVESFPMRTTNHETAAYFMEHMEYDDPIDAKLYNLAKQIFEEEIAYVKRWKNITI